MINSTNFRISRLAQTLEQRYDKLLAGAQNGFGQRLPEYEIDKTSLAVRREICISFCGVTKLEAALELGPP